MCQDSLDMSKKLFNKLLIYSLWYLRSNAQLSYVSGTGITLRNSLAHAECAQIIVSQVAVKFAYYIYTSYI